MTTWELIRSMVQRGYEFQSGQHVKGLRGYWACFIHVDSDTREECDKCYKKSPIPWAVCGHAMTAHRAVVMAAKIALEKQVAIPGTERFEL